MSALINVLQDRQGFANLAAISSFIPQSSGRVEKSSDQSGPCRTQFA